MTLNTPLTLAAVYSVKLARFMTLWIALFFVDKHLQLSFFRSDVLRQDNNNNNKLLLLMPYALLIDLAFMTLLLLVLLLLRSLFSPYDPSFVVDDALLKTLALDYVASSLAILALASLLARSFYCILSTQQRLHLPAVRALSSLLLLVSAILLAFPWFLLL